MSDDRVAQRPSPAARPSALPFVPTQNERWYLHVTADWAARIARGERLDPEPRRTARDLAFAREVLGLREGTRVLELGCGWGRCTTELVRMGCRVTAIDLSPAMVALTRRRLAELGLTAAVHVATVRLLPAFEGRFDAVVGFRDDSAISCSQEADTMRTLQRLGASMHPGGRMLFGTGDYPHESPASQRLVRQTVAGEVVEHVTFDAATGWSVNESWWPLPDGPLRLTRRRKHYAPHELAVLFEGAGLELIATYANLDVDQPYEARPEGLVVVARSTPATA